MAPHGKCLAMGANNRLDVIVHRHSFDRDLRVMSIDEAMVEAETGAKRVANQKFTRLLVCIYSLVEIKRSGDKYTMDMLYDD